MKLLQNHHRCKFVILWFIFLSPIFGPAAFAWTGYDVVDNSEIEIGSGNLVREGEEIRFYDWQNQEDRRAQVRAVDYLFNTTRLEVYDYIDQKTRIFDMNN